MKETIEWIHTEDIDFHTYIWTDEKIKPRAVFYIIHGSVEHAGRYKSFAENLVKEGYVVIAPDLRGHGQTGLKQNSLGHFTDGPMGWELCVHDLKFIYDHIHDSYPNLPLILFGHSMGSYLVRCFIKEYPVECAGLIISGTGGFAKGLGDLGIWLAKLIMHIKGKAYKSKFLTALVYDSLNKRIGRTETSFDFLSRDKTVVKTYIEDPLCGYTCSAEYIHELLLGTRKSNEGPMFDLKQDKLPILLMSGENDPVGDKKSKGIKGVYTKYKEKNKNVSFNLYPKARHELLNEINREEVIADVLAWLSSHCKTC